MIIYWGKYDKPEQFISSKANKWIYEGNPNKENNYQWSVANFKEINYSGFPGEVKNKTERMTQDCYLPQYFNGTQKIVIFRCQYP